MGILPLPFLGKTDHPSIKKKGLFAAFTLGLIFGIALGPCTFAYMAPMLAVTFKLATTGFAYAMLLLLAFAVGHCLVIVVAGTSTGLVQRYLNWNERTRGACILRRICGVLLLLGVGLQQRWEWNYTIMWEPRKKRPGTLEKDLPALFA